MQHAAFIESLGDTGAVAAKLGQRDSTISNWKQRSIPWRWRMAIAEIAKKEGVDMPEGFLDPASAVQESRA